MNTHLECIWRASAWNGAGAAGRGVHSTLYLVVMTVFWNSGETERTNVARRAELWADSFSASELADPCHTPATPPAPLSSLALFLSIDPPSRSRAMHPSLALQPCLSTPSFLPPTPLSALHPPSRTRPRRLTAHQPWPTRSCRAAAPRSHWPCAPPPPTPTRTSRS